MNDQWEEWEKGTLGYQLEEVRAQLRQALAEMDELVRRQGWLWRGLLRLSKVLAWFLVRYRRLRRQHRFWKTHRELKRAFRG